MKEITFQHISTFFEKYSSMKPLKEVFTSAIKNSVERIRSGGKILLCGNGGSAADCEHIAGELLKEFYIKRPIPQSFVVKLQADYGATGEALAQTLQGGIPAISLVSQTGIISAFSNDANADMAYAQQVYVYAGSQDIFIGLSTSGNAFNVYHAACVARAVGCAVIGYTGQTGGKLKTVSDWLFNVPEQETYKVQELHLPLYHLYCMCLENEIFGV